MTAAEAGPFVGLNPFEEQNAEFFFGRRRETELLLANLLAADLTVLYGGSGVGKSSLVRAGLLPHLRRSSSVATAVLIDSWHDDTVATLESAAEIGSSRKLSSRPDRSEGGVRAVFERWEDNASGLIVVVLDQFEEYLLYHGSGSEDPLLTAIADTVLIERCPITFLISMREDSYTQLDRFKRRIPRLFEHSFRVEHLSERAAQESIEGPVRRYNEKAVPSARMRLEPRLPEALIDDLRPDGSRGLIEAPYLQLVLTRLWKAAQTDLTLEMSVAALRDLGGSRKVVAQHVRTTLDRLDEDDQEVVAAIFDRLVTPSLAKIAHTAEDLAAFAQQPSSRVESVLRQLTAADARILREVEPPLDQPDATRFELFHDVLATPVLDWGTRHVRKVSGLVVEAEAARVAAVPVSSGWSGEADGVFGASGVRLLGVAGALMQLADDQVKPFSRWVSVAGIGGGAFVAAYLATGHTPRELVELLRIADFLPMIRVRTLDVLLAPFGAGGPSRQGARLTRWLDDALEGTTFSTAPALRLLALDITRAEMMVLPDSLANYQDAHGELIDPSAFRLAEAVRMCMSFPFAIAPIELTHAETGQASLIADASVTGQFPVWLFDTQRPPVRPTIGIKVMNTGRRGPRQRSGLLAGLYQPLDYLTAAVDSAADGYFTPHSSTSRTIAVSSRAISQTEAMPMAERKWLLEAGATAAKQFTASWDPAEYRNSSGVPLAVGA